MKVKPVNKSLLVRPRRLRAQKDHGDELLCGEVLASDDLQFRVGDHVLFEEQDANFFAKDRVILREFQVLAIIEEPELALVPDGEEELPAPTPIGARRRRRRPDPVPAAADDSPDEPEDHVG